MFLKKEKRKKKVQDEYVKIKEVTFSRAKPGIFSFNGTTLIEQPG